MTFIRPTPNVGCLLGGIERSGPFADAGAMHDSIGQYAHALGWIVGFEWPAPYVGVGGRIVRGRIDLMLRRGSDVVAMELDNRYPRPRSVEKLLGVQDATIRIVVVRDRVRRYQCRGVLVVGVSARGRDEYWQDGRPDWAAHYVAQR